MAALDDSVFQNLEQVDDKTLKFTMSPVSVTYANTLRRAVQTEVQILGFRGDMLDDGSTADVKVFKNTTPMSNEMLADRVGLLPIQMQAGGWEKESVLFRLRVKNETDDIRLVTASDFECLKVSAEAADADGRIQIPNTQFFYPNPVTGETCIIAVLKPMADGQEPEEIHLEAYATMGKGREHTRFNPVAQCAYSYTRDDDAGRIKEMWHRWLTQQKKVDPKDLDKDAERKAVLEREFRSLEIYRCFKTDGNGEPYSYDFTVESVGVIEPNKIIFDALNAIALLCEKYAALDTGDLPDSVDIRPADARMKGFDFWFQAEDHTLGNLLQTWLDDNRIGDGAISFAGYKVPHPLRDEMVLRIGVEDGSEKTARLAIAEASKACADMFRGWAAQWSGATASAGLKTPTFEGDAKTMWQGHAAAKAAARGAR
jgi:DNA-directed RNA polymerase subunit L/DNA-directed RNA polymerase alpha subunit